MYMKDEYNNYCSDDDDYTDYFNLKTELKDEYDENIEDDFFEQCIRETFDKNRQEIKCTMCDKIILTLNKNNRFDVKEESYRHSDFQCNYLFLCKKCTIKHIKETHLNECPVCHSFCKNVEMEMTTHLKKNKKWCYNCIYRAKN